ncbi:MAG: 4'-phosphopantetheinyl transferase family protein [Lachnospiraceae bacterium]
MNTIFFDEDKLFRKFSYPEPDELHIWIFSIKKSSLLTEDMKSLPEYELKRAAAFSREEDRLRYLVSRSLLRKILSIYLELPASSFRFEKGEHGKPFLADQKIQFNLSHSEDYIALVFCANSPVGIDIEKIRPKARIESLVNRFFHPDEARIFSGLNEQQKIDFMFRGWTLREAFLKGIGCGLTLPTNSFSVTSSTEEPSTFYITKSQEDYSSWRIVSVPAPENYYCSAAYQV